MAGEPSDAACRPLLQRMERSPNSRVSSLTLLKRERLLVPLGFDDAADRSPATRPGSSALTRMRRGPMLQAVKTVEWAYASVAWSLINLVEIKWCRRR